MLTVAPEDRGTALLLDAVEDFRERADASGHRKRSLAIWTGLVVATMLVMFSIRNEPSYLWAALVLLAAGAVFAEFAGVSYNAMLPQVCTPETVGRVSGFGWSMGYPTAQRDALYQQLFKEKNPRELVRLLNENDIDYVVIDYELRQVKFKATLNEEIYMKYFSKVYEDKEKRFGALTIYKVPACFCENAAANSP